MAYDARTGISRFGMGMKTAALSISPSLKNFTWQEQCTYYNLALDVKAVGRTRGDLLEMPDPQLNDDLPSDVVDILNRPMIWPRNPPRDADVAGRQPRSSAREAGPVGDYHLPPGVRPAQLQEGTNASRSRHQGNGPHLRRFIDQGLRLYVNNRRIEAFDPTYWMQSARHVRVEGLTETRSRLVGSFGRSTCPWQTGRRRPLG